MDFKFYYDVIIVGAGPAGIFAALELVKHNKRVCILDRGKLIKERKCPILNKKTDRCINCDSCAITTGFGGSGAASDGKILDCDNVFTKGIGGILDEYINDDKYFFQLIHEVNERFIEFGADPKYYYPSKDILKNVISSAAKVGINILTAKIRHIGTDASRKVLGKMYDYLKTKCEIMMNQEVTDISVTKEGYKLLVTDLNSGIEKIHNYAKQIILAPGRNGSAWLEKIIKNFNIPIAAMPVDIGVRVEVSDDICKDITDNFYELKALYNTPTFDDRVRSFCMNPSGYVVSEYNATHNLVTANGHSLKSTKSTNTNFAVLVTKNFTNPFNDPIGYATTIAKLSNMLSGGGLLVQRLVDLRNGRRSTIDRIAKGLIKPTTNAEAGDLSLALPHRYIVDIIEFLDALNNVIPGVNGGDTLLYGTEIKLYSIRPELTNRLTPRKYNNMYMIGDGAGITRSIAQAAASGLYVARNIIG